MPRGEPRERAEWWQDQPGYLLGRQLADGRWLILTREIFTWALLVCTPEWVLERYQYEATAAAGVAWDQWDGAGDPPGPWTRHTRWNQAIRRRRPDGTIYTAP
jgi:hypothetical protein